MKAQAKILASLHRVFSLPEFPNGMGSGRSSNKRLIEPTLRDGLVLDIGCGMGDRALLYGSSKSCTIVGIDIEPTRAYCARLRSIQECAPVSIVIADAAALPFAVNCFDHVISQDTWEHIARPGLALKECNRVLQPSATVTISVLPYYSPWGAHAWHWIPVPWLHVPFPRRHFFRLVAFVEGRRKVNARLPLAVRQPWSDPDDPAHARGLTVRALRNHFASSQLLVERWHQQLVGAGHHPVLAFLATWLAKIPYMDELLTGLVIVEAQKPPEPSDYVSI